MSRPHDWSDLMLAPVALAVDRRIEELGRLDAEELAVRIAVETNLEPRTEADRRESLLRAVAYLVEMHEWQLSWDDRGIRLSHGDHTLVLGLPGTARAYVTAVAVS